MGRFVPISFTTNVAEKSAPTVPGAKAYYDGKQCWQYKIVYDRPGTYTYTLPSNAICARTVLVGGGGKPKCGSVAADGSGCNSAAGAGGSYSEKHHAVSGGSTAFTLVVGRQEQDTTLACNAVNVHTAGGASGCIPGAASGGDWNSRGGCTGYTCNYCGGSYSHHCGSCKYTCSTQCCGYCIMFQCDIASHDGTGCCTSTYVGGGSAGSWLAQCGGSSWNACAAGVTSHGAVGGGGAGIGGWADCHCNCVWHYNCCMCICMMGCQYVPPYLTWCTNCPPSAQGGGGTSQSQSQCRSFSSQSCQSGVWKGGDGGRGGSNSQESQAWHVEWGYGAYCSYPFGSAYCYTTHCYSCNYAGPQRESWWDIHDMVGSGSPGTLASKANTSGCRGHFLGNRPMNSGEGSGTGAIMTTCCNPTMMGNMIGMTGGGSEQPAINWQTLCCLGVNAQCDQAWLMVDALFPYFITCAGTLGGSGSTSWYGYTSKAGKGGGGGQAKSQILCICHGGAYDCCNQVASTPLAFPPCLLDQLTSNAGTGMAIIYYREA